MLADRCSPDTSHRKLRLPLLLPLLPLLLVAIVWVAIALAAIIYSLLLIEQMLEVLDPTPPDQFRDRNQPVSRSLFADETSANRLTRSGSFCCGWLWCTSDTLAPEKPLPLSQRVRRFLRAPRRRLQLLLAESSTATLLEAPWLLLALWRGTPLRRARDRARERGRLPQRRRVSHDPSRAYFFLLARDELVWHATEAASSRGAMPAGSIRLDSIVEARRSPPCVSPVSPLCLPYISYRRGAPAPPCVSPVSPLYLPCISPVSPLYLLRLDSIVEARPASLAPSSSAPCPSSLAPLPRTPPPTHPTLAAPCGQVLAEPPRSEAWGEGEEGMPPLHCFPLLVRTSASRSRSRQGRSQPLGRRWSPTTALSVLSSELPHALLHGVTHGAADEGPADMRELHLAAATEVEREGWIAMLHKATKLLRHSEHPTEPDDAEPAQPRAPALSRLWHSA